VLDWLQQWPGFIVALAAVFLPGLAVGAALRLRGLALAALAPVGSVVVLGTLAITYDRLKIPWSLASVAIGVAGVAGMVWLICLRLTRPQPVSSSTHSRWLLLGGLVVGGVFAAMRLGIYIGEPYGINGSNDTVFHLNAVRWVIETAEASPFSITGVIGASSFYPAAWHQIASVVVMGSGADLVVAANVVSIVLGAVVWPLSITWFTQVVLSDTHVARIAVPLSAALSSALLTFPYLMFQWGVLYPYALSLAIVPAAAAAIILCIKRMTSRAPLRERLSELLVALIIAVASVGSVAMAQPATLLTLGVLAVAWSTWFAWGERRAQRRWIWLSATGASWIALAILWGRLSSATSGSHWAPFRSKLDAVIDVVVNAQMWMPPLYVVSALALLGAVCAYWHREVRVMVTAWIVFGALYVLGASVGNEWVRNQLLGAWYADPYRFAAMAPLAVVPLASVGLAHLVLWASDALTRGSRGGRRSDRTKRVIATGSALAIIAIGQAIMLVAMPLIPMANVFTGVWDPRSRYAITQDSYISVDELALMKRLPDLVDEDENLIVNPSTGAALTYAIGGRDAFPRTWQPPRVSEWLVLQEELRDAATKPEVCDALASFGDPEYVLDFGIGERSPGKWVMPGMTDFEGQDGFSLVAREGEASLWRIDACAQ
jgi:hypothetical protein